MTQRILIEGGIARTIETRVLSEVPLAALTPFMIQRVPTISPFQPEGTIITAYDPQNNRGIFVIQQKPRIVHMDMHFDTGPNGAAQEDYDQRNDENHAIFNLAMPYLSFVYGFTLQQPETTRRVIVGNDGTFTIDDVRLYWHSLPLRSPQDKLWVAKLPNVYEDGRICWGNTTADTGTLAGRIEDQTKNFFTNGFSSHLELSHRKPLSYASLAAWERDSGDVAPWTNWTEWTEPNPITAASLTATFGAIETGPTGTIQLPPPPRVFGIGAARAWTRTLDPRARRVIAMTIAEELALPDPTRDRIHDMIHGEGALAPDAPPPTPRLAGAARTRAARTRDA